MNTETTSDTPPAPEPALEQPPAAGGKRERKAPSQEQAKLAADKKRLKRKLEKLLASNDAAALAAAASKLDGEDGGEEPARQAEPAALEKAAPTAEKTAAAAKVPTAEETAAMLPLANACFAMVAGPLAGTKFDPMQPRPNPLGGEPIVPAAAIVEALAPVLAKYVPAMVTTPEGQLALALAMWLGPPVVETVKAKVMGDGADKPGAEGAGTRAG
jgi:hypothetical protein